MAKTVEHQRPKENDSPRREEKKYSHQNNCWKRQIEMVLEYFTQALIFTKVTFGHMDGHMKFN